MARDPANLLKHGIQACLDRADSIRTVKKRKLPNIVSAEEEGEQTRSLCFMAALPSVDLELNPSVHLVPQVRRASVEHNVIDDGADKATGGRYGRERIAGGAQALAEVGGPC